MSYRSSPAFAIGGVSPTLERKALPFPVEERPGLLGSRVLTLYPSDNEALQELCDLLEGGEFLYGCEADMSFVSVLRKVIGGKSIYTP